MSALDARLGELARCQAEIARLEAFIAARPDSAEGARRMLAGEQEHLRRLESWLALAGVRT